jgi:uncharacterized protein DUF6647
LDALIATYLAWIIAQTGWSAPVHPSIHFVTRRELVRLHGSPDSNAMDVEALYSHSEGSVYLLREWRADDLRHKSTLLHELVHHAQRSNSVVLPCTAAYERQAYDLQIKWLHEQGVADPYGLIKTNELSIYLLSACRDGS